MKWRIALPGLIVVIGAAAYWLWSQNAKPLDDPSLAPSETIAAESAVRERLPTESPASAIRFQSVDAGIDFRYYGSPSPETYMTEQNGGGVAIFDFDGDDRMDLFLVNGSHFENTAENADAGSMLCRNRGEMQFQAVSNSSGLTQIGFGMGCAAGDFDNDGFADLLVTGYGRNRLWRNNGDGTFSETPVPGFDTAGQWSTSAAWADFDADGDLDLYIVNYVDYSPNDAPCFTEHRPPIRRPCGPVGRTGQADRLYENLGDGTFRDLSKESGIGAFQGKGLGAVVADFNDDTLLDIYVANDTTENLLFLNRGNMQFNEAGLIGGAAVGSEGVPRSGMGVASADYNLDGRFDLFVTNFMNEPNDLYENLGVAGFRATNASMGLDSSSRPKLGFGAVFADFDLDRDPDLVIVNGHVWDLRSAGLGYEYAMYPLAFENESGARFRDISPRAGNYFERQWIGRGLAVGDLDNDGAADLVATHLVEPVKVLRNQSQRSLESVRLRLIGHRSSREALGARIDVKSGESIASLRSPAGDSFQSSCDPRIIVPIEPGSRELTFRVHWPGRPAQDWRTIPLNPAEAPETTLLIHEQP